MNTSQYMDKQIMDLASQGSSAQSKDFLDLMKHPEEDHQEHAGGRGKNGSDEDVDGMRPEEIVPSYDFQPIRPITATIPSSKSVSYDGGSAAKIWSSDDLNLNSSATIRNYSSLDALETAKVIVEKERSKFNTSSLVSDIDEAMKKHTDEVLYALEVLSARVTQLESRTRSLENSVDDLKLSVGNNYGNTDGKMRQLENILREVQNGVQILKDKHDVMEGHLHIAKLQISKPGQPQETHNTTHADTVHPSPSVPQQGPPSQSSFQQPPAVPSQLVSVPPNQPIPPPPSQIPGQFPQTPHRDPYFPPPSQEAPHPPHQLPPYQPPPPHQQYPPPSLPQYTQPAPPPANPSQFHPSGHHLEEKPYLPSHTQQYPPPGHRQPPSGPPQQQPSQQLYGAPSHMYESLPNRSSSGFPSGYAHTPDPYGGPPSQYSSTSPRKPQQSGGGSGYPQLPTARVLPQALPTASGINSGSGSGGSGNRVPVDDVVDKVTTMGFPREQVRATVRKLTENGQPVDLNIVLDKLMNESNVQPPRGWPFGR